ncbi:amino acid/amide ABC transporter substrate-binding protein (HAAT family) [Zymomonas mobilis]|uniref:Amino acid/amide ABC transporter substrate-binding protein (HAAT family) n=2 Tax=Zymomonas mobilis TaxID=542 RepID=A0A542W3B2_ZYMMB|nr:amino acid/amide ABC transporter substrate-binding protein (HAAT family) [Zymomonas mobilis]
MNVFRYRLKKNMLFLSGLLLTATLTACGGSSGSHPKTASSNTPTSSSIEKQSDRDQTADNSSFSNNSESPNAPRAQAVHSVAVIVPLSGSFANIGQSIANSAQMAVSDIADRHTGIKITYYDSAKGAVAAVNKAIADGNKLILGPVLSGDIRAMAPIARNAHIPMITFSNDSTIAGNGVYTMSFTVGPGVQRVVKYALDHKLSRFAALLPNGVYGRKASASLLRTVAASGGSVAAMANYNRTPQEISDAVTKLGQDYDAVLIADSSRIARMVAPLLPKKDGVKPQILGNELWSNDNTLKNVPALYDAWFASVPDSMFRQLSVKYKARYGVNPPRLASLGYDAVLLAARISPNWPSDGDFPEKKLFAPNGFMGIDGAFRFNNQGVSEHALAIQKVSADGINVIDPAPSGFSK